ncbi:MAG: DUF6011 domain-containing protein [Bacillota bacterium]
MTEKEKLLKAEQSNRSTTNVADRGPTGKCIRCGRRLTRPSSVSRRLGHVCWVKSKGELFQNELTTTPQEWERREQLLRSGGEHDFGYWDCVVNTEYGPSVLYHAMRVSVRYRDGMFEAYGVIDQAGVREERVFYKGTSVRDCWQAAVAAGPESQAEAYRAERLIKRQWRIEAKRKAGAVA